MGRLFRLDRRAVLEVSGEDAGDFLQGLVTNDVKLAAGGGAVFAGLLTPQGKLMFDFFIIGHNGGFALDVDSSLADELLKRLTFYKLRAKVELRRLKGAMVCAAPDGDYEHEGNGEALAFADPRADCMGQRIIFLPGTNPPASARTGEAAWLAHRIQCAMPEGGADFAYGDVFPHDAGMDQLHGVSFSKGCYVGQEVVSRMQHKSSLRKRIMALEGKVDLPTGPVPIMAGGKKIGLVGSASGRHGLGMVRLDQAASALEQGEVLRAGEVEVKLLRPAWADYGDSFS